MAIFFILCTFLMLSHTICTGSGVICIVIFDVHWSEYFAGNLEYMWTSTDKWVSWLHSQIAPNGNFRSWMSEKNMKIILGEKNSKILVSGTAIPILWLFSDNITYIHRFHFWQRHKLYTHFLMIARQLSVVRILVSLFQTYGFGY
jgi:hypothetical protein